MRQAKALASLAAGFSLLAGQALADVITFSANVPVQETDFTSSVSLQRFDTSLGTLTSVLITLEGTTEGAIRVENRSASPRVVTSNLGAVITLTRPDTSVLVVALPTSTFTDALTGFDGVIDFAGSSGREHANITTTDTRSTTTSSPSDLALFSGLGNILLPLLGVGDSSATGSGNLRTEFDNFAGAVVSITYTFTPTPIPEPLTISLFGAGLLGLGMVSRRRAH